MGCAGSLKKLKCKKCGKDFFDGSFHSSTYHTGLCIPCYDKTHRPLTRLLFGPTEENFWRCPVCNRPFTFHHDLEDHMVLRHAAEKEIFYGGPDKD
jgi:uncharacterized protein with PIN domain